MKKLIIAAALAAITTPVIAGNLDAPVYEPEFLPVLIEQDTSSSSGGWIVPVLALLVLGAVVAN
jgi:hypothetical protein